MATVPPPPKPINPALVDSEGYIDDRIRRTRRALKLVDLSAGLITLAIGLLAFVLIGAVLDQWIIPGGLSGGGRTALFGALLLGLAWYGWRQFVPLLRPINPVYAAHTIERGAPTLKNSLLNLLLFRHHRQHMSARVYHALEQQAAQRLSTTVLDGSVDRSALLRLGYALLAIVAVCTIYAALSPKNLALSAGRVLAPWANLSAPSRVQILDVKPGAASVACGEQVDVSAEIHGLKADEKVRLRYSTDDQGTVDETITMERPSPESRRFEGQLPRGGDGSPAVGVQKGLSYWIEAGDARSPKFKLAVFQRPTIIVQKVRYDFPSYTGFPTKEVDNTGDIRGVEGTEVTISALSNQPIKSAQVDFDADGRSDLPMTVEGNHATARFTLALREDRRTPLHGSYVLRLTAADGRTDADPPKYSIDVTPDYAPEVRITEPEEPEQAARVDEIVPIGVEARDPDFALSSVELVGKVGDSDEQTLVKLLEKPHEGRFGTIKPFTPADAGLKPGDVLEYWAKAKDNRRPAGNEGFSEHRKLKIIGPDKPADGQQKPQPGGKKQPGEQQNGDKGEADESGQGGPQQPGGEAGEESGDGGEGQPGASGSAGGEGESQEKTEGDQGAGGAGGSGESQNENSEQQEGEEGSTGASGGNSDQSPEQSEKESNSGGNAGKPTEGDKQAGESQSKPGESAAGSQQGEPQGSEPSKVSSAGDDDGTAFQRMAERLQQNQPEQGEPKEGDSEEGDAPQQGRQQQPGEQNSENKSQNAAGSDGEQNKGEQQQPQEGGDPAANQKPGEQGGQPNSKQSPPDKSNGAAGKGQKPSPQQPPGEGTPPAGAEESASDAEQQGASGGEKSNSRPGADKPREAKPGDGKPEDQQAGEQPSPDSAMNRDNGESGAGESTGKEQGSPGSDEAFKKGTEKSDQENRKGSDDQQPPAGSPDEQESNSKGGQGGDKSGGGQEGAGQQADSAGKGGAGQNEAADEGAGRAEEEGQGETSSKPGQDQQAAGKTGESSGDQPGAGSEQGDAAQQQGDQSKSEAKPGEPQGASKEGQPGGEQGGDKSPAGSPDSPAGSEPAGGEQPGADATGQPPQQSGQPPSSPNEQDKPPSDQPPGAEGAAGSAQPQGGGVGGTNASGSSSSETAEEKADKANLEFARKQTDLVLESLDQQLAKKQVDRELLKNLGWSEAELRQFVDRWKNLKTRAEGQGDEAAAANQELDATLRSLGLRKASTTKFRATAKADQLRVNDAYRARTPAEYAERVRQYSKGVSGGKED